MKQPLKLTLILPFCIAALSSFGGNRIPSDLPLHTKNASDIKMLSTFLFAANGNMADGNRVVFDPLYSNAVDANDALKLMNPGENFCLKRSSAILAVEARQPITDADSIFYYMKNLIPQVYRLEISPQNLSGTAISCELVDRFLNTRRNINLADSNHLTLEVTSDPASRASDRLVVVFSRVITHPPFNFLKIDAINNDNKSVTINWEVNQELDIAQYDIERSKDNIHFNTLSTTLPLHNDRDGGNYQYTDMQPYHADNFYRIRALDKNGAPVYSEKVQSFIAGPVTTMNIYPNPVINHSFQVQLQKLSPGKYYLQLSNSAGQRIYSCPLNINSDNFKQAIILNNNVGKGDYNLSLYSEDGIVDTQRLNVQ